MSEGHTQAGRYPLVVLWQEAQIARERVNGRIVTDILLLDACIASHLSTDDAARDRFKEMIEGIANGR